MSPLDEALVMLSQICAIACVEQSQCKPCVIEPGNSPQSLWKKTP